MLVLSRKIGESIVINHDIYLTVLGIHGSTIRLGIDAPQTIPVHREEIQRRIRQAQVSTYPVITDGRSLGRV